MSGTIVPDFTIRALETPGRELRRLSLLIQIPADPGEPAGGVFVIGVLGEGFSILFSGAEPVAFRFEGAAEIHVGEAVAFIAGRLKSALEPRNGFIDFALLNKVGANVVIWISESRIHFDRLVALRNRVVDASHETVCPAEKRVGLGCGTGFDRLLVALDRLLEFAVHLVLVGFLEKADSEFLLPGRFVHGVPLIQILIGYVAE